MTDVACMPMSCDLHGLQLYIIRVSVAALWMSSDSTKRKHKSLQFENGVRLCVTVYEHKHPTLQPSSEFINIQLSVSWVQAPPLTSVQGVSVRGVNASARSWNLIRMHGAGKREWSVCSDPGKPRTLRVNPPKGCGRVRIAWKSVLAVVGLGLQCGREVRVHCEFL